MAGRVARPDDGGHSGVREANAAGSGQENGRDWRVWRGRERGGVNLGVELQAHGARKQDACGHSGQHREERGWAQPDVREKASELRGRGKSRGLADGDCCHYVSFTMTSDVF